MIYVYIYIFFITTMWNAVLVQIIVSYYTYKEQQIYEHFPLSNEQKLVILNKEVLLSMRTNFDKPDQMKELFKKLQRMYKIFCYDLLSALYMKYDN